jgi:hypothetical protein
MNRRLVVTVLMLIGVPWPAECTEKPASTVSKKEQATASPNQVEPIGSARMLADRTLVLSLRAETGEAIGHAAFTYKKDDPKYAEILRYIGGLEPGEEKIVWPFPDKK